jgi:XRE family aerobic/anaerobic benzoate catabolism transcriptional regulator
MQRVIEQGDLRPMAGSNEAMEDLQNILASREDFYSKAQFRLDTSRQSLDDTFSSLKDLAREELLAGAGS